MHDRSKRPTAEPAKTSTDSVADDPVTAYAKRIASGDLPAGKWHRLACERHLKDLDDTTSRWEFRPQLAAKAFGIFKLFRHYKGREWAGKPIVLEPWQQFIVGSIMGWVDKETGLRRFRNAFIELPRGSGKSTIAGGMLVLLTFFDGESGAEGYSFAPLAVDTPVPTPSGWTTMGELHVGDTVFDEAGKPTEVTFVSPVMTGRPCYEIRFHDGQTIVSDAEHRWRVQSVSSATPSLAGIPKSEWRQTSIRRGYQTVTTEHMAGTILTSWGSRNHAIPLTRPLDLPDIDLPIPPYTLGVWLGDGRENRGGICMHPSDASILVGTEVDGFSFSRQKHPTLMYGTLLGLRTLLRTNGLLNNKHIPPSYFRASERQRMALLQGLMDTDGTCTATGECRFCNKNENLSRGVAELATSLGFLAHHRPISVNGTTYYIVSFRAPRSSPVFTLKRKWKRQPPRITGKSGRRFVTAVTPIESQPVRCISVAAESSLYLVGRGMVATHNTKKDQARITFQAGRQMVLRSPALKEHIEVSKYNLHSLATESKMEALGSDSDTLDGLRPNCAIADEVHRHPSASLIEVMESGMGTRSQPLLFEITTAGEDDTSVYGQHFLLSTRVLERIVELDEWFCFIASADQEDDWTQEATWIKANPNYNVSVKPEFLRKECKKALANPAEQAKFRRLYLGQKVQALEGYFSLDDWKACPELPEAEELRKYPCWIGLDLSSSIDVTAAVLVWKLPNDEIAIEPHFWLPADNLEDRAHRDRVPYGMYVPKWLSLTDGNTVDLPTVRKSVAAMAKHWKTKAVCYDPWHAPEFVQNLQDQDNVKCVSVQQTFQNLSPAMKWLQTLILKRRVRHDANPLMTLMISNVIPRPDENGNYRPSKKRSRGRIDGPTAAMNALALVAREQTVRPAVFFLGGVN